MYTETSAINNLVARNDAGDTAEMQHTGVKALCDDFFQHYPIAQRVSQSPGKRHSARYVPTWIDTHRITAR